MTKGGDPGKYHPVGVMRLEKTPGTRNGRLDERRWFQPPATRWKPAERVKGYLIVGGKPDAVEIAQSSK
jgi:hypothetical protein